MSKRPANKESTETSTSDELNDDYSLHDDIIENRLNSIFPARKPDLIDVQDALYDVQKVLIFFGMGVREQMDESDCAGFSVIMRILSDTVGQVLHVIKKHQREEGKNNE